MGDRTKGGLPRVRHRRFAKQRESLGDVLRQPIQQPVAVVFSFDESVERLVADGMPREWLVSLCPNPGGARESLTKSGVKIVVIDDQGMDETTSGWLLDQVRRWAPQALVAYIAASHGIEVERRARSHNVQYYFSRPIDREHTVKVLKAFATAAR
jgi:DNA-binding NtrC family response regulator